jgi:2',3'-cyclic-nucleotide 2'-phosphodiesterase/3'-nucleotidase
MLGEYEAVMNNYKAAGGEHSMFRSKPVVKNIPTDKSELLAAYIMKKVRLKRR